MTIENESGPDQPLTASPWIGPLVLAASLVVVLAMFAHAVRGSWR